MNSLKKDLESYDEEIRESMPIDIVVETKTASGNINGVIFSTTVHKWKSDLKLNFPGKKFAYVETNEQGRKEYETELQSSDDDSLKFSCLNDETTIDIAVTTFMRFCAYDLPGENTEPRSNIAPQLESSFSHDLTEIGILSLKRLEQSILDRINPWLYNDTKYLAPIVSLCQSSGSGKSKLSFELLRRHIGFYIVFRLKDQTGYPFKNLISDMLDDMISTYSDPPYDLNSLEYSSCAVGKILHFFARIITRQVVEIVELANEDSLNSAIGKFAKIFSQNEKLTYDCLTEEMEMKNLYSNAGLANDFKFVTVEMVSEFISKILKNPELCFSRTLTNDEISICHSLASQILSFPFIFVIDEAEVLAKKTNFSNLNGFEAFRRAMSYLKPNTNILVLTLGTKSNIIDLNPRVVDSSKRFTNRKELPFPIILSSNLNILSKEYPPHSINPTYEMLLNPFYFKYLCTLGHGIWSSLPFDTVINNGKDKIINGTSQDFSFVLFLWMILTGMTANPLSVESGTMVANHMGYLLDISDDLKRLLVMYPPEPILAMIAHVIIDKDIKNDELFSVLQRKFDAADIDRGKTAELFGGMIILRAIWNSKSVASTNQYNESKEEMIKICPMLNAIWERNYHVLQERTPVEVKEDIDRLKQQKENDIITPEVYSESISNLEKELITLNYGELRQFEYYKVHQVKDFLMTLLQIPEDRISILTNNLPVDVLDGLVNGTQIVSLDDFSENLECRLEKFEPKRPRLADDRIADSSRYIITETMLRLCITLQLIIKFPPGYYGLDYAIPVLLRDNSLTFIGVQIKRANANLSDDVYKMRAKLHYVKCPDRDCIGERCQKCTKNETLENIYKNQISIILSLDENETFPKFTPFTFNYASKGKYAMNLLKTGKGAGKKPSKLNMDFFKPLATIRKPLKDDVLISKSVWWDELVGIQNINISKDKTIPFVKDGFVHRQYCISVRGWNNFSLLFTGFDSSEKIAQKLMNPEGLIRHFPSSRNDPEFVRKIVYDLSLTFPFYSEELRRLNGENSWFDRLNEEKLIERNWKPVNKLQNISTVFESEDNSKHEKDILTEAETAVEEEENVFEGRKSSHSVLPSKRLRINLNMPSKKKKENEEENEEEKVQEEVEEEVEE